MMHALSIFGTSSDSGKSSVTLALTRLYQKMGYKVAPFKAQNMSNNSAVCDDGSEIGRAQYLQAESINLPTSYHLNPILLKPQGQARSQLVVNGKVVQTIDAKDYYKNIDQLKPYVIDSFQYLAQQSDLVIAEGAGSPVELNLISRDLSNTFVAEQFNSKIIIVADIERGGVFASIYGTHQLLNQKLRQNVIGVIINKFRGDISLFDEGKKIIEDRFKIPVLGILPYTKLNFDMEDSLSLTNYQQNKPNPVIKIALIHLPHLSNYNDIDPLIADQELQLNIIDSYRPLDGYDLILLPGTKTTIKDLLWLKSNGLYNEILSSSSFIFGICGGYQMLFKTLNDNEGIENDNPVVEKGFGFIDAVISFRKKKRLRRTSYNLFNRKLNGYEIHCGYADKHDLFYQSENLAGTHLHGIFDNDSFRTDFFRALNPNYQGYQSYKDYKNEQIDHFVHTVKNHLNLDALFLP